MKKILVMMLVATLGISLSNTSLAKEDKSHGHDKDNDRHERDDEENEHRKGTKKISICHREEEGEYHLIRVSEKAKKAHMKHGDGLPGGQVPNMEGKVFTDKCDIKSTWELVETVTVNSALKDGVNSTMSLENGKTYRFDVSGTWQNRGWEYVDAKYTTGDNWVNQTDAPAGGYPERLLDFQVNNGWIDWGTYSSTHEYTTNFTGTGTPVNFRVFDGDVTTETQNEGWFGDNQGYLTVKIYKMN